GGTSLLLAAMGAQVTAIEEVRKYVEAVRLLKEAFAIDRLDVRAMSLYPLDDPAFQDAFDLVLFAGVIYHVTDPLLALRLVFNCLKDGGTMLLETLGLETPEQIVRYHGPTHFAEGETPEPGRRGGWNWF